MNTLKAIFLGALQGFTEFLPVSSSGHLAVFGQWFGRISSTLAFEVLLHLATLIAVVIVYRERIKKVNFNFLVLLFIASVPAGVIGILFNDVIEKAFSSSLVIGIAFLFTGTVLFLVGKLPEGKKEQVGIKEALGMGLAQTIAILPGVSRSGMTIASGLALGLKREEAAAFSFMMSIPVILGAGLLELKDLLEVGSEGGGLALVLGFGAAVLTGIIAINLVRKLLKSDNFNWFSYYLWGMGVLTIVISLI